MNMEDVWPGVRKVCDTGKSEFWVLPLDEGYVSLTLWNASLEVQVVYHGASEVVLLKFKRMTVERLKKLLRRLLEPPTPKGSR